MSTPDNQKLLKVNDSDKPRGILPETEGHSTDVQPTLLDKAKTHKWKIVAVVAVLLLALILGLTLGGKKDEPVPPTPVPPTPVPPIPVPTPNAGINPYYINNATLGTTKYSVMGQLNFDQKKWDNITIDQYIAQNLIKMDPHNIPNGLNNNLTNTVNFEFSQVDFKIHKLNFQDASQVKYSPPADLVMTRSASVEMSLDMVGFNLTADPFGFELRSTRTEGDVLVAISNYSNFVMSDKFMQLDLQVPSQRIYGFGERQRQFTLDEGTWTMWANGRPNSYDDGTGGKQTYGVHPFALIQTKQKDEFVGIYFRNTNAASPIITHKTKADNVTADGGTISYITTGGQMEVFFFLKDNAKNVIKAYQNFIGKPSLPPFWALGWHATTTADPATNLQTVKDLVTAYNTGGIPLESVWLDKSYMDNYKDFSVNANFDGLFDYTNTTLHNANIKLGLVLGPSLSSTSEQDALYSDAQQSGALIQSFINTSQALTQTVWTGADNTGPGHQNVFLDFFHTDGVRIWGDGLSSLYDAVPYDALSLENNEASGQCNGECPDGLPVPPLQSETKSFYQKYPMQGPLSEELSGRQNETWYYTYTDQAEESTYTLPFTPGMSPLDYLSLSLNATHPSNGLSEYDVHSLFGHLEGKVTQQWLLNAQPDKRTFLLSRSTFSGSGAHVGHHLGENSRTWDDMKHSIAGVMNFNMFGIPLTGPETCGYFGTAANDELCARWIQLATFYPLARQHRAAGAAGGPANEPYALASPYKEMAIAAIQDRLQYIRHLYTCLFETSQDGGTCFDPLLLHYPTDDNVFDSTKTENSFIVGCALMITPVLDAVAAGTTQMSAYFPTGKWVSMKNYATIITGANNEQMIDIPFAADTVNVWLRPGYMVPFQPNGANKFKNTEDVLASAETHLVANRDGNGHAEGKLFIDKGITLTELDDKTYEYYEFHLSANSLKKWIRNTQATAQVGNGLKSVIITDAADLTSVDFACWAATDGTITAMDFAYDATKFTQTLTAKTGNINTFTLRDIYFGDSTKDVNLCDPTTNYYKLKAPADLTTSHTTVMVTNAQPGALQDLALDLAVLSTGVVSVKWNYATQPAGWKTPFQVPTDIVDAGTDYSTTEILSNRVKINEDATTKAISIDILAADKTTPLYTISGDMQLGEYFNTFRGTAHTRAAGFQGLMGLAEQTTTDLFLKDGLYSLWSLDTPNPVETGMAPGSNMYGTHPFLMGAATDGSWFGVFANLAAAQDWRITNDATSGAVSVATMATGGVGDLRFMVGADPNAVTMAYHTVVGKPVVTPQWALGWNQCRWGYRTTGELEAVVANYSTYQLPLDTIWSDIDYMKDYKVFTIDEDNFAGLGAFVAGLANKTMHWIPIIDPGVAQRLPSIEEYLPYTDGIADDIFIKAANGAPITGSVWADDAVFPDWSHPKTQAYWTKWLNALRAMAAFDGLWLDMNEPSNMLCTGTCYDDQKAASPSQWKLPYIPTGRNLEDKTLSLDAVHHSGATELDTHSLFGTEEVKATHDYFTSINKRPMIIERSSFAGMGKYGSRWLGDNFSNGEYMGYSVTGIMAHNIAGIPLAGADICGFIGNTTAELCARWYVVGAFYPFSRNHNAWDTVAQEPWNFDTVYAKSVTYLDVIRMAMRTKLHLIRYYYTQLSKIQTEGGAFYKPLFFEFPDLAGAYADQELNVMLGSGVKLGVQSTGTGIDSTNYYFPAGLWCEIINRKGADGCFTQATSGTVATSSLAFEFALHLRAGHIIPMQDGATLAEAGVSTTAGLQAHPVDFHVLPLCGAATCVASGDYINDDGMSLDLTARNTYALSYTQPVGVTPATLVLTLTTTGAATVINENDKLGTVEIYNAKAYGLDTGAYSVSAMIGGTATPLDDAVYVASSDRLTATGGATAPDLTKITTFTLTRKA